MGPLSPDSPQLGNRLVPGTRRENDRAEAGESPGANRMERKQNEGAEREDGERTLPNVPEMVYLLQTPLPPKATSFSS